MTRALLALGLVALAAAAPAAAAERLVVMPGRSFVPGRLTALVGDTVTWENRDTETHTVYAPGVLDSGYLAPGGRFSFTFTQQGTYAYVCTVHRFMRGEVDVYSIVLEGPSEAIPPHGQATLTGLAPTGTARVTIEARRADGSYAAVGPVTPAPDGSFAAVVSPSLPTHYRAVSGSLASPDVLVSVAARVRLEVLGARGRAVLLRAEAVPSQAGAPVQLERYARERFTWVRVARAALGERSRATFRFTPHRRVQLRLRLLRGVDGYGPGVSPARWVRSPGRPGG